MDEKEHPFKRLVSDIVNPGQASNPGTEGLLADAKETVIQWKNYRGEPYEQMAHDLIREASTEKNPTIRLQFVAQVLAMMDIAGRSPEKRG